MEFPSNSQNPIVPSREGKPPEKDKPDLKVVEDGEEVVIRKKKMGDRLKDMFLKDGKQRFETYVAEILLPAAQEMVFEATLQGLARAILGEQRAKELRVPTRTAASNITTRLVGNTPRHVDYDRYSKPSTSILSRRARTNHELDDIILPTLGAAERVIDKMISVADKYTAVTVADLYEILDIDGGTFADQSYGWDIDMLRTARPRRTHSGYLLDLPKPEPLRIR